MLSFSVTPLTDLPSHRIIRSYFATTKLHEQEQDPTNVELSHLWSEDRQREETRFASLMSELGEMAKELGIASISKSSDSLSSVDCSDSSATNTTSNIQEDHNSSSRLELLPKNLVPVNKSVQPHIDSVRPTTVAPAIVYAYKDSFKERPTEKRFKSSEEEREDKWMSDMNNKVQILLQQVNRVLGTTVAPISVPSPLPSEEDAQKSLPDDEKGFWSDEDLSTDIISLFSRSGEFSDNCCMLVENGYEYDTSVTTSDLDYDSFLDDVSVDTADTSLSLEGPLGNKDVQVLGHEHEEP
ncbi:hypothetical protein AX17_006440 [Amanita inopinata Kibby_2008]|nr:hypothetical protein AX17_006440 [Amanita inopinata Kibby_2008]